MSSSAKAMGWRIRETPFDLGQTPADLVVLSFSDSDLGAFAAGWHRAAGKLPIPLRLANLVALKHPMSVDTYVQQTLPGVKGILIRLIGGENYWPYGLMQLQDLARRHGIALAVLPADGREDAALDAYSTLPVSTLRRLAGACAMPGGAVAAQAALAQLALAAGLYAGPVPGDKTVPDCGWYDPDSGVIAPPAEMRRAIVVTFYRSYLTAADTDPMDALIRGLARAGLCGLRAVRALAEGRPRRWISCARRWPRSTPVRHHQRHRLFGARGRMGRRRWMRPVARCFRWRCPPRAGATGRRRSAACRLPIWPCMWCCPRWMAACSPGVVSFKSPGRRDPDLQFSRFAHRADPARVDAVVDRVMRLATGLPQRPRRSANWRWCCPPIPAAPIRSPMRSGWTRWHRPRRCWRDLGAQRAMRYAAAPMTWRRPLT